MKKLNNQEMARLLYRQSISEDSYWIGVDEILSHPDFANLSDAEKMKLALAEVQSRKFQGRSLFEGDDK